MNGRLPLIVLWSLWTAAAGAAEVKIFRLDSREAVLKGTAERVSVDPLGAVELARKLERLAAIEEPFVFAAAGHPGGWVVGTGNSGKVLRIGEGGETQELAALAEPEVFAVHVDADGTVLAASSPHGKVYRVGGGEAEVVFEPKASYVWELARDAEGRLLVATGLPGRLLRVGDGGQAETLYESPDSHVRQVAVLPGGDLLLGTAGQGLVVRVGTDGKAETLHDAIHPEVLAFAVSPAGRIFAAVLASEASLVDLSAAVAAAGGAASTPASAGQTQEEGTAEASVSVAVQGSSTVGSRSSTFSGPRSQVLEISPGKVEEIASFESETVHSLLWHDGALWIGTGQEGRLYRFTERRLVQETALEERQIAGLVAGPAGVAAVTANASAIYRLDDRTESAGTYTSSVLDAAQVSRFGSFLWQGSLPKGAGVEVELRSGMSSAPDATWTPWSAAGAVRCTGCENGSGRGQEIELAGVGHGRYVQWRAKLSAGRGAAGPRLESAELTYRQENLKPKIGKLEALDPGQILVPSSFNPQNQTFEPWSPNRDGIFTTLRFEKPKNGSLKKLWKKGYRTLQWSAKDDNADSLVYRLDFRRETGKRETGRRETGRGETGRRETGRAEAEADGWLAMVEEIDDSHYSFDATVLPDGVYRYRLTASDRRDRPGAEALADHKLSESVVIDHSPPVLESRSRRGSAITVELFDALSPMRDAAVSVDAREWRPATAADGLLDGRRETLRIEVPDAARLLLLRVSDAAHNVVTFDLMTDSTGRATGD